MNTSHTPQSKAIAYLRVSTSEQSADGLGIAAQIASVQAYAIARGIELVEIVTEVASGKTTARRPLLAAALDDLDAGKADRLIVAKVDRLGRNLRDLLNIADRGERKGWGIVTLDLDLDTSTPSGRFSLQMMGAVAELERQMIADRTRGALAEARKRGTVLGAPRQIADATYARAIELRAAGLSYRAIARQMTSEGFTRGDGACSWSAPTVRALCISPYGMSQPERIAA